MQADCPLAMPQVAQSWGLLIGTVVMNPKTGQTLAAVIMIVFMLTGGYFTRGIIPAGPSVCLCLRCKGFLEFEEGQMLRSARQHSKGNLYWYWVNQSR